MKSTKKKINTNGYMVKWGVYGLGAATILLFIGWVCINNKLVLDGIYYIVNQLKCFPREYSEDNLYATEISASLIMVTMASVLSGGGEDVLWENTVRYSLVNPKIVNFISITVALIVNLFFSSFAFWNNDSILFFVYFVTDMLMLILMTYKMIGAFFAKNSTRNNLVKKYKFSMSTTEKVIVRGALRDKCLLFIDERNISDLSDNIDFLAKCECDSELIEVLDYLSKVDGELFWNYAEKYNKVENQHISRIAHDLCIDLISGHKDSELLKRIIESLYGERSAVNNVNIVFDGFGAMVSESLNDHINKLAKEGLQKINSTYKLMDEIEKKSTEEGRAFFSENYVKKYVVDNINSIYTDDSRMRVNLPVDLLVYTIIGNNRDSFNVLITYFESVRKQYQFKVECVLKEIDVLLEAMLNQWLEEDSDQNTYYAKYLEVDWWETHLKILYDVIVPGYKAYKQYVRIPFLGPHEAYINNVIRKSSNYILLTETNIKKLIDVCAPITYK